MSNDEAKDILTANGWHFDSECFCGGAIKHIFKKTSNPAFEVHLFVKYFEFNVKEYALTIRARQPYTNLLSTINSL